MVAGQIDYAKTEQCAAIRLLGSIVAVGVEFRDVGKHNSDHAALFFNYRDVDATNAPNNTIAACSIDAWNPARKKSGNVCLVGILLNFVRLAAPTMHRHGARVRRAKRNRVDRRSRILLPLPFRRPPSSTARTSRRSTSRASRC